MLSKKILHIGLYVALFYMTISTNFIGELYNPELINILHNNYLVKHILGYITLLTFIIFSDSKNLNLIEDFKISIITYILFVMSTKNSPHYFILSILCIFVAFILDKINNIYIKDKRNKETINEIHNYLGTLGVLLIIYSFIKEYTKYKKIYKNNFSFKKFMFRKI